MPSSSCLAPTSFISPKLLTLSSYSLPEQSSIIQFKLDYTKTFSGNSNLIKAVIELVAQHPKAKILELFGIKINIENVDRFKDIDKSLIQAMRPCILQNLQEKGVLSISRLGAYQLLESGPQNFYLASFLVLPPEASDVSIALHQGEPGYVSMFVGVDNRLAYIRNIIEHGLITGRLASDHSHPYCQIYGDA